MPPTRIPLDFEEFLKSFEAHNARFLLRGSYALPRKWGNPDSRNFGHSRIRSNSLSGFAYSAENESHEEDRLTGKNGYATFPAHWSGASAARRGLFTILAAGGGTHASFGRHACVFALGKEWKGPLLPGSTSRTGGDTSGYQYLNYGHTGQWVAATIVRVRCSHCASVLQFGIPYPNDQKS